MTAIEQRLNTIIAEAERTQLYGEVTLRFRKGHLIFVTETRTTPFIESLKDKTHDYDCNER